MSCISTTITFNVGTIKVSVADVSINFGILLGYALVRDPNILKRRGTNGSEALQHRL